MSSLNAASYHPYLLTIIIYILLMASTYLLTYFIIVLRLHLFILFGQFGLHLLFIQTRFMNLFKRLQTHILKFILVDIRGLVRGVKIWMLGTKFHIISNDCSWHFNHWTLYIAWFNLLVDGSVCELFVCD